MHRYAFQPAMAKDMAELSNSGRDPCGERSPDVPSRNGLLRNQSLYEESVTFCFSVFSGTIVETGIVKNNRDGSIDLVYTRARNRGGAPDSGEQKRGKWFRRTVNNRGTDLATICPFNSSVVIDSREIIARRGVSRNSMAAVMADNNRIR